ncbi:MAG: hypothetical protein IK120_01150 [Muribaculaceae bacterium]|nr:hypothetical protein [Muribaculaceae bacterium]
MKRIVFTALLGLATMSINAGIPDPGDPHCVYCGVNLKTGEPHKSSCPYYEAPKEEESSHSTHLKDYTPIPEMTPAEHALIYEVGVDGVKPCSHCKSLKHQPWCEIKNMQKWAKVYRANALNAITEAQRKKALWDYNRMVDNLKLFLNLNYTKADLKAYQRDLEREEAERQAQAAAKQTVPPSPPSYQHLSSVDIKGNYDKKIGYSNWATAYGKTFPNGEERWVLYDQDGQEVGQFLKVESVPVPTGLDVFLVKNLDGKWGVYNAGGDAIVEPKYESIKVVVAQQGGESREFYDVTLRDERGLLRHGIINGAIAGDDNQTIPCVCDHIELIDRSPSNRGVLAKYTIDGNSGVMDADSGDVLIQPGYSYVNTYFTLKGMYFIVGDGTHFGAYDAATMEEVASPTDARTLYQVREIIDKRDQ